MIVLLQLWPEAILELKKKLDSLKFRISIEEMQNVIKFYNKEDIKKDLFSFKGSYVLLSGSTQSPNQLATSELLNIFHYYNERINRKDLLSKYIEYKNKKKEYEEKEDNERKEFVKKHIFFNIWDDYSDDDFETFGRFEDDKKILEEDSENKKVLNLLKNEFLKLYPNLKIDISGRDMNFYNLTHELREELVEKMKNSNLSYKGYKFEIYSES